ncbi:hypothetical protein HY250_03020, partial [Candidatus Azambacteria bacterium]|nr:hypothetical protein [Candidatus Azambacteria bacterium]
DGANGNAADLTSKISSFWSTNAVNALAYDATSGAVYIGGSGGKFGRLSVGNGGLSGTYTSAVYDTGQATDFATVSWTETLNGQTLAMSVRAGNSNPPTDGAWTAVANGADTGAVFDGKRYVQYQAAFSTTDAAFLPSLDSMQINWQTAANYNFSLSYLSSFSSILAGQSVRVGSVTVAAQSPQDASIVDRTNLTSSDSHVTFSPNAYCTPSSGSCVVDVYASFPSTGTYAITLTGNNASATYPYGLTATTSFSLTVSPQMTYMLGLSANSGEVIRSSASGAYATPTFQTMLTVTRTGGADEGVASITAAAPSGITADPSPLNSAPFGTTFTSIITMSAASTVTAGDYTFTITVVPALSGSSNQQTISFTLQVRDPLSYSLAGGSGTVTQGNTISAYIPANYSSGGSETVQSFSVVSIVPSVSLASGESLPSVSFPTSSCGPLPPSNATCARMSVQTFSNTPAYVYTITVTARSQITNSAPTSDAVYTLTVTGPYDFSLAYGAPVAPCTQSTSCSVEQSNTMQIAVNITSTALAGEPVALTVSGSPVTPGISYFQDSATNSTSCSPYSGHACVATITILTTSATSQNIYLVYITGNTLASSIPRNHTLTPEYTLTVTEGFTFDITLGPPASGTTINTGNMTVSVQATVTLRTGTAPQPVTLAVFGSLPSGVTATFPSNNPCTPSCSQIIALRAQGTTAGNYTITIRGQYGTYIVDKTYVLTVEDPFDFCLKWTAGNPCSGASATGDIFTIPSAAPLDVPYSATWNAGGTAAVSFAAPSPAAQLSVSISPSGCGTLNQTTSCPGTISFEALSGLTPATYTVTMTAFSSSLSGSVSKSIIMRLTVGSSFRFSLALSPDSARVDPKPGVTSADVIAALTNPPAGPVTLSIQNETKNYTLPAGVTASFTGSPCTPSSDAIGATCPAPPQVTFSVAASAADGVYNVPIFGSSGPAEVVAYFTLKIGPLNLTQYQSSDLLTEAHQRPAPFFMWSPQAPFVGDQVNFDAASSTVWGGSGMVPADVTNAYFGWSFTGINSPTVSNSYTASGIAIPTLSVRDTNPSSVCYTSVATDTTQTEACQCATSTDAFLNGGITVSKPRPFFREIKP